jgi:hypothetical protein
LSAATSSQAAVMMPFCCDGVVVVVVLGAVVGVVVGVVVVWVLLCVFLLVFLLVWVLLWVVVGPVVKGKKRETIVLLENVSVARGRRLYSPL